MMVREGNEAAWWRRTGRGAAIALVVAGAVSLVLFLIPAGGRTMLGLPLDAFLGGLVAPLAVLVAVFWFSARQRRLDRRFDVAED
jgi:putative solute:sodium symporter small subunit